MTRQALFLASVAILAGCGRGTPVDQTTIPDDASKPAPSATVPPASSAVVPPADGADADGPSTVAASPDRDANSPDRPVPGPLDQAAGDIDLSSPEATWRTYCRAHVDQLFDVTYETFTPQARPEFVVRLAGSAQRAIPSGDREGRDTLDRLADEHGAPRSLIGLFVKNNAETPQQQVAVVESAYAGVRDEKAYVEKVARLVRDRKASASAEESPSTKIAREVRENFAKSRLENVRIEGDTAVADAVFPNGRSNPRKFRRADGRWHLDYDWSVER